MLRQGLLKTMHSKNNLYTTSLRKQLMQSPPPSAYTSLRQPTSIKKAAYAALKEFPLHLLWIVQKHTHTTQLCPHKVYV